MEDAVEDTKKGPPITPPDKPRPEAYYRGMHVEVLKKGKPVGLGVVREYSSDAGEYIGNPEQWIEVEMHVPGYGPSIRKFRRGNFHSSRDYRGWSPARETGGNLIIRPLGRPS